MSGALVLAHAAHGNLLGAPELFLEVALVVVVGLTVVALGASWPAPRLAAAASGRLLPPGSARVARAATAVGATVAALVLLTAVAAGLAATDDPTENIATFVVSLPFLVGGGVGLSLLLDGWWGAISPFTTAARSLSDRDGAVPVDEAPPWLAPAMVGSYVWLTTAFHDGGEVRSIGAWLAIYSAVALAATVRWGRGWAASGEGFATLFGAVGLLAPVGCDADTGRIRLRAPLTGLGGATVAPGTAATLLVTAGGVAFGALNALDWWQLDVVGARDGWSRTAVDTAGLLFVVGLVAVVWRGGQLLAGSEGTALVPLAAGVVVAFLLTDLAMRTIDVLALASDPFGQGWDLFGTADWFPDQAWTRSPRLAWAEIAALVVGAVLAAVAAHDRAVPALRTSRIETATATLLAVAGLVLLLR